MTSSCLACIYTSHSNAEEKSKHDSVIRYTRYWDINFIHLKFNNKRAFLSHRVKKTQNICKIIDIYWNIFSPLCTDGVNHCNIAKTALRLEQNGWHVAGNIFKCIFLNENCYHLIQISLEFNFWGSVENKAAMVLAVLCCQAASHFLYQYWPRTMTSYDKDYKDIFTVWSHFESYLGFGFTEVDSINQLTLEQQYMLSALHNPNHAGGCSGNFRSQGISRHGSDP